MKNGIYLLLILLLSVFVAGGDDSVVVLYVKGAYNDYPTLNIDLAKELPDGAVVRKMSFKKILQKVTDRRSFAKSFLRATADVSRKVKLLKRRFPEKRITIVCEDLSGLIFWGYLQNFATSIQGQEGLADQEDFGLCFINTPFFGRKPSSNSMELEQLVSGSEIPGLLLEQHAIRNVFSQQNNPPLFIVSSGLPERPRTGSWLKEGQIISTQRPGTESELQYKDMVRQIADYCVGSRISTRKRINGYALAVKTKSRDIKIKLISLEQDKLFTASRSNSTGFLTWYSLPKGLYALSCFSNGVRHNYNIRLGSDSFLKYYERNTEIMRGIVLFQTQTGGNNALFSFPQRTFEKNEECLSRSIPQLDFSNMVMEFSLENVNVQAVNRFRPVVIFNQEGFAGGDWNINGSRLEIRITGSQGGGAQSNTNKIMVALNCDINRNGKIDHGSEYHENTSPMKVDWMNKHKIRLDMAVTGGTTKINLLVDGESALGLTVPQAYVNSLPLLSIGGRKFDRYYNNAINAKMTAFVIDNVVEN